MDKPHSKFKRSVAGAIIVLAMGNAFTLWEIRREANQRCRETRDRAAATAPALQQLLVAQRKDGDTNTAQVWEQYLAKSKQHPFPPC